MLEKTGKGVEVHKEQVPSKRAQLCVLGAWGESHSTHRAAPAEEVPGPQPRLSPGASGPPQTRGAELYPGTKLWR